MSNYKYFVRSVGTSIKLKSGMSISVSILGFAAAFLPMAISLGLKSFTDIVRVLPNNPERFKPALLSFSMLAFLYVAQTVYTLLQNHYANEDAARVRRYIKEKTMELTTSIPYKYIENYGNFKKELDFVTRYAGEKTAGSVSLIFGWVAGIVSFISISYILFAVSPWIVFALIITCVPAVILSSMQKDDEYRMKTKWMKEGSLTIHYSDICRQIDPMKEIRFFGLYDYIKNKWRSLADKYIVMKNKVTKKHVLYNSIADILRNGVYLIILMITAKKVYQYPDNGLGVCMLVITASGQLQAITTKLFSGAVGIFSDIKYMRNFFELLETERENDEANVKPFTNADIEFDNVCFTYPNSENKALDRLNVKIRQGEKIAVVGANGSGKSTFVNLLCGLYKPERGTAKINGSTIYDNASAARRTISVIFQNFCQYQDTLRNNITISDPLCNVNDSEIMELAGLTGADEAITTRNALLDEVIGVFSDTGENLSGGQWQKIAITRALYKKDARIYILDEPTAALDPLSEANIYRNFTKLTGDKTTVLISHRLGITSVVDRVLVFDEGKIVEDGTHNELIAKSGVYAKMYKAQAKWYN